MRRAINVKRISQLLNFQSIFQNETPLGTPVIEPIVDEPSVDEPPVDEPDSEAVVEDSPLKQNTPPGAGKDGFRVILYNDEHHDAEEVAEQIHKATQYAMPKCWAIMTEAHTKGRAICFHGTREKCHAAARVLREIRLQCEVDCDD